MLATASLGIQAGGWPVIPVVGVLVTEFLLVSGGWLLIARQLPHDENARVLRHLLPGALIVGGGFVAMKAAMVLYLVPGSVALDARYGDIGQAIAFITWAYWIGFIVVLSAGLNAAVFKSSQRTRP